MTVAPAWAVPVLLSMALLEADLPSIASRYSVRPSPGSKADGDRI